MLRERDRKKKVTRSGSPELMPEQTKDNVCPATQTSKEAARLLNIASTQRLQGALPVIVL